MFANDNDNDNDFVGVAWSRTWLAIFAEMESVGCLSRRRYIPP